MLGARQLESLYAFYRLLGGDPGEGGGAWLLDFCGVRLEMHEHSSQPLPQLGFALGSADAVDEISLTLALAGHRLLEAPRRAGEAGRYESLLLDPEGNRVTLTV